MKVLLSNRFKRSYKKLPKHIQSDFDIKIALFMKNPRDPSLGTHKLKGKMQSCLSFYLIKGFRVLFEFTAQNTVQLLDVGSHDKYRKWPD